MYDAFFNVRTFHIKKSNFIFFYFCWWFQTSASHFSLTEAFPWCKHYNFTIHFACNSLSTEICTSTLVSSSRFFFPNLLNYILWVPASWCKKFVVYSSYHKHPLRGVPRKRCSENMQQIYRRAPMPKCNFNKVAKQLYWNHSSAWVFSCKFAAYFRNTIF